jgi:hypothetical protein
LCTGLGEGGGGWLCAYDWHRGLSPGRPRSPDDDRLPVVVVAIIIVVVPPAIVITAWRGRRRRGRRWRGRRWRGRRRWGRRSADKLKLEVDARGGVCRASGLQRAVLATVGTDPGRRVAVPEKAVALGAKPPVTLRSSAAGARSAARFRTRRGVPVYNGQFKVQARRGMCRASGL